MRYITYPLETDATTILEEVFDHIANEFPGWEPSDGNLDVVFAEAFAATAADLRDLASTVPDTIFRTFGASIIGIPPVDAASASVGSTWVASDNAGHLIEADTLVGIRDIAGELQVFEVLVDVTIPIGSTATAAGEVLLVAMNAGVEATNIGAPGTTAELIDSLAWVQSVTITSATSGGTDAEADDVYLARLATELRLLSPRPILPDDFAVLARRIPGVARSLAIDGWNPANNTANNERMITVAIADASGNVLSATIRASVASYLDSLREINFVVNVIDPTYTTIDVTYSIKVTTGYTSASVLAAVTAALTQYLDPSQWGLDDVYTPSSWRTLTSVYINELIAFIDRQPGVDRVVSATMRTGANAYAATDIALTGVAPLVRSGVINGTAV